MPVRLTNNESRGLSFRLGFNVAQDPAALRDGLDELVAARCHSQLLAQFGDEDVDDLGLRLIVGPAIEVLQQHRSSDHIVAREGEQLEHPIFHLGDADRMAVDADEALDLVDRPPAALSDVRRRDAASSLSSGDRLTGDPISSCWMSASALCASSTSREPSSKRRRERSIIDSTSARRAESDSSAMICARLPRPSRYLG